MKVSYVRSRRVGLIAATILALGLGGCSCSKKKPDDEERLKQKIDVTSVHLYASVKKALSTSDADPKLKAAVERMLILLADGDPKNMKAAFSQLGLGDLMLLGKAVLTLKGEGQEIVRGTKDEGDPLIRKLLILLGVPSAIADLFNRSTDHGALFLVEGILKFNEKSPVPIPMEIILYEAWRTEPSSITVPGMDSLVLSVRSHYYGMSDFCDLSERDAKATRESLQTNKELLQAIQLVSEGAIRPDDKAAAAVISILKLIGDSGPALCYYSRGDDKLARPWLKAILDDIESSGMPVTEETTALRIVYDCGGDDSEIAKGEAALAKLPAPKNDFQKTDREVLKAYCDASKENKIDILRKISLSAKLIKIAAKAAQESSTVQDLGETRIYRAVYGIAALCDKASSTSSEVSGAVDKIKGFFDKK
jgi:hypothetical protein